jgi:uncharacterized protein
VSTQRFRRYVLRTTDAVAATAFYDAVLGHRGDAIFPLHEAALARGARPHWLGLIAVRDIGGVEAVAGRFVERGATRFGPAAGVADFAVLRDPGGAIVGVTDGTAASAARIVWHQLNTEDPARAAANYADLFGWSMTPVDLGSLGHHHHISFGPGEPPVGLLSDVAGRPGVHPHWLFFFGVPSLDSAVETVLANGGKVIGPIALPNGVRLAACDDPQGAAFGLIEPDGAARLSEARL